MNKRSLSQIIAKTQYYHIEDSSLEINNLFTYLKKADPQKRLLVQMDWDGPPFASGNNNWKILLNYCAFRWICLRDIVKRYNLLSLAVNDHCPDFSRLRG